MQRIFTSEEQARSERRLCALRLTPNGLPQGSVFQSAWNGVASGGFLARYGRQQFAVWKAHHASFNGALQRLEKMTPDGMRAQIDLTITDDFPLAQAIVIISAVLVDTEIVS